MDTVPEISLDNPFPLWYSDNTYMYYILQKGAAVWQKLPTA
jgi:hypothetical protein